ncbi:MAG: hypothetical protein ABR535_04000, partial [Pyrinomonadaceae bacterium]
LPAVPVNRTPATPPLSDRIQERSAFVGNFVNSPWLRPVGLAAALFVSLLLVVYAVRLSRSTSAEGQSTAAQPTSEQQRAASGPALETQAVVDESRPVGETPREVETVTSPRQKPRTAEKKPETETARRAERETSRTEPKPEPARKTERRQNPAVERTETRRRYPAGATRERVVREKVRPSASDIESIFTGIPSRRVRDDRRRPN